MTKGTQRRVVRKRMSKGELLGELMLLEYAMRHEIRKASDLHDSLRGFQLMFQDLMTRVRKELKE